MRCPDCGKSNPTHIEFCERCSGDLYARRRHLEICLPVVGSIEVPKSIRKALVR